MNGYYRKKFHVDHFWKLKSYKFFLQIRGHHVAQLDPLGILQADLSETVPADLSLEYWGLGELLI